jgi:nucleotide-binding universal stress UspA family protein
MIGVFSRVLVPVELEVAAPLSLDTARMAEVAPGEWVAAAPSTVRALQLAAELAAGGEVCIAHATPSFAQYATWITPARTGELDDAARAHARAALSTIAGRHTAGVTLVYAIAPARPLDLIVDTVHDRGSQLVVIGASERSRVNRAFVGSTVERLVRESPCPVIVVPSTGE